MDGPYIFAQSTNYLSAPPLAGDGDALGVDGALVGVEVEHLVLGPRPRSHVQQVAADLHAKS